MKKKSFFLLFFLVMLVLLMITCLATGCGDAPKEDAGEPGALPKEELKLEDIEYSVYENQKFGFSLSYPSIFISGTQDELGESIALERADGITNLLIWGEENPNGLTGNDIVEYVKEGAESTIDAYSDEGVYNILYEREGVYVYQCGVVDGQQSFQFELTYPKKEREIFSSITNDMTESLMMQRQMKIENQENAEPLINAQ